MHNGELAKNTKRMSSKTRCHVSAKQMFRTWTKTLLWRAEAGGANGTTAPGIPDRRASKV